MSEQHISLSRKMGLDTVGFLMMAHMIPPEKILEQALLMESYGANCLYVTDSAHAFLGAIALHDIKSYLNEEELASVVFHGGLPPIPITDRTSFISLTTRPTDLISSCAPAKPTRMRGNCPAPLPFPSTVGQAAVDVAQYNQQGDAEQQRDHARGGEQNLYRE